MRIVGGEPLWHRVVTVMMLLYLCSIDQFFVVDIAVSSLLCFCNEVDGENLSRD